MIYLINSSKLNLLIYTKEKIKNEKDIKKILCSLLVVVMCLTSIPYTKFINDDLGVVAKAASYSTGDHITFGSYPGEPISDSYIIAKLAEQEPINGRVSFRGIEYYKMGAGNYWTSVPIEWTVVTVDEQGIYILSDTYISSGYV